MDAPNLAFAQVVSAHKQRVAEYLGHLLQRSRPASLYEPVQYTMSGDGKRLRPVLVLIATEAFRGDLDKAVPVAAAVELLHNFTLVHDDIMDQDETRRGRPTVHAKWDEATALLAGDGLVALAYQSLLKSRSENIQEIARLFTNGLLELCEGQALDREFETRSAVELTEYLEMIRKKTACLLSMCGQIGAMVAGVNADHVATMQRFGESLGIAFQIQDDLLDITCDPKLLGKDFGSDVKQHKKTFMLNHAQETGSPEQKQKLKHYLQKPEISFEDIIEVRRIFEETGTLAHTRQKIECYISEAESCLKALNSVADIAYLKQFLELILHRRA